MRALPPSSPRGFTLLEVVVSVAILALLVGVSLPLFDLASQAAKESETAGRMEVLDYGVRAYLADVGALPPDLASLRTNVSAASGWTGPYVADRFAGGVTPAEGEPDLDAWGRPFDFTPLPGPSARLRSAGRDGLLGNSDDLVKTVRGEDVFRRETLERLEVVEVALLAFVRQYRPGAEFPSDTDVDAIFATLVSRGLLGADPRYRQDAWGNGFVPDPPAMPGRPVCRFRSPLF